MKKRCMACGLEEAPGHFSMHWWDIGSSRGWVCTFCHVGRGKGDCVDTYKRIRANERAAA